MKSLTQHFRPRMALRILLVLGITFLAAVALWNTLQPPSVEAESNFQRAFLDAYPAAHNTSLNDCKLCHTQGAELNSYGSDFATHGHSVVGIELMDSDQDGITNIREIERGTMPGDPQWRPASLLQNPQQTAEPIRAAAGVYKLIAWNDLGMHCMGPDYSNISILPPYNTLWAQLILQGPTPEIVTNGVTIEYSIDNNTYSVGKTNFWTYAKALFGVDLPPNIGLAGKGLSGEMDLAGDHFVAVGIPIVPFNDGATPAPRNWKPYQMAHLVARDAATGQVLAETRPVIPVSEEMNCKVCHSDGKQEDISTGNVETNILTLHDKEERTSLMSNRPVLCAECHADNALGAPGNPDVPNLSQAMHNRHRVDGNAALPASDPDNAGPSVVTEGTNNCYLCHPGVKTQCLRDVMWARGKTCTDCHGTTADVAAPARNPWVDLPRCGNGDCHGAQYAENDGLRYRDSVGHGGLYCEACHGSPHAILPSTQPNDNIQNIALQGFAGTLSDCKVCHATVPAGPGPHGLVPTPTTPSPTATATATPPGGCLAKPQKPTLKSPANNTATNDTRPTLKWNAAPCAATYTVTVKNIATGEKVDGAKNVTKLKFETIPLARATTYKWFVKACNTFGCVKSKEWTFTVD